MMTTMIRRLGVAVFLLIASQVSQAQAPSGNISFTIGGTNSFVYDFSGDYKLTETMLSPGGVGSDLSFGFSTTEDPRGKVSGFGTTLLMVGGNAVAAQYRVTGNASRGGSKLPHLTLNVQLTGNDTISGTLTSFNISIVYSLDVDPNSGTFFGTARGNARFTKFGSARIRRDIAEMPLPDNLGDGSFAVNVNIVALDTLGGGGNIVLSNGRSLPVTLTGTYSPGSARTRLRLVGKNEARGVSLNISFLQAADETILESVNGRLMGLSVKE